LLIRRTLRRLSEFERFVRWQQALMVCFAARSFFAARWIEGGPMGGSHGGVCDVGEKVRSLEEILKDGQSWEEVEDAGSTPQMERTHWLDSNGR